MIITNFSINFRGYTAPEYAIHGQLSEKVDTYSFGIVVLEIVSGRRCTEVPAEFQGEQCLLEHVSQPIYNSNLSNLSTTK